MPDWFTREFVEETITSMFRRAEMAQLAGGISEKDRVEGRAIPDGYWFDYLTSYYLPPNVNLDSPPQ